MVIQQPEYDRRVAGHQPPLPVPEVIERIAQDLPAEMENRERHSFCSGRRAQPPRRRHRDGPVPLVGDAPAPTTVEDTARPADAFHPTADVVIRPYSTPCAAPTRRWTGSAPATMGISGARCSARCKITYRTPDYMLSCAQTIAGKPGYQQHIHRPRSGLTPSCFPCTAAVRTNPTTVLGGVSAPPRSRTC